MIILRSRMFISKEDSAELSKHYAEQAKNGVIVLDNYTDLVHVSEQDNVINVIAGLDPENEEEQSEEEPVMQQ